MKNNNIILLVGESGSGKTTIANKLNDKYGMTQVLSFTNRPKRKEDWNGRASHIFVSTDYIYALKDIVAYTKFDGYEYCAIKQQLDNSDIYVVDVKGVKAVKKLYKGNKNPIVVYIRTSDETRAKRMHKRGDKKEDIIRRLIHDKKEFSDALSICDLCVEADDLTINEVSQIVREIYEDKYVF